MCFFSIFFVYIPNTFPFPSSPLTICPISPLPSALWCAFNPRYREAEESSECKSTQILHVSFKKAKQAGIRNICGSHLDYCLDQVGRTRYLRYPKLKISGDSGHQAVIYEWELGKPAVPVFQPGMGSLPCGRPCTPCGCCPNPCC